MPYIAAAALLSGCGTIEENAWTNGVSREDALAIKSALQTEKKAREIYSYEREDDGSILVQSDVGFFKAWHVRGRWIFHEVVIVTWELPCDGLTIRCSGNNILD